VRLVVPASVASLPELTFVASYTNTDAYTVAAASLTVFAWCYGARTRWRPRARVLLGLAVGLVLLGKYTAYLVAPLSLLVVVLTSARQPRRVGSTLLTAALVATAVSGWWFVRSAVLYHDPLGFQVQAAAVRAVAPEFAPPEELTHDPIGLLTRSYWLPVTLESAFARFDYMSLWLPRGFVAIWTALVTVAALAVPAWLLVSLPRLAHPRHRVHLGLYVPLFLVVAGAFVEDVVYTLTSGNSPQGRYLLFASVPFFLLLSLAIARPLPRLAWTLWGVPAFLAVANAWSYVEVIRPAYSG
jgi:hypothetical protein